MTTELTVSADCYFIAQWLWYSIYRAHSQSRAQASCYLTPEQHSDTGKDAKLIRSCSGFATTRHPGARFLGLPVPPLPGVDCSGSHHHQASSCSPDTVALTEVRSWEYILCRNRDDAGCSDSQRTHPMCPGGARVRPGFCTPTMLEIRAQRHNDHSTQLPGVSRTRSLTRPPPLPPCHTHSTVRS